MYKAIYPFQSQEGGEFSFEKGDTMEIIEKDENGWWLARSGGKEGWVPSNYLEEYVAPKPSPPPPAPPARKRAPPPPVPQQQQQQQQQSAATNFNNNAANRISQQFGGPAPTNNGVPAWRAALDAKNRSAADNNNAPASIANKRAPPVIPSSKPVIPARNNVSAPPIPSRPGGPGGPQAPPRNSSPAAQSLADAVSK